MDCDCEIGRGKKMARPENGSRKIPVHCDSCQARIDGLCEGCAPEVLRVIASHKTGDRKIKAGQDLFSPGEPCGAIYNLVEGWIFLYDLLENGRRQILHFALRGAVFAIGRASCRERVCPYV